MAFDYIQFGTEIVGVFVLSTFGYYAWRLLSSFRKGLLERGWRLVAAGAIVLAIAQIPFLASLVFPPHSMAILVPAGNLARFAGIILLTLGFRDQYKIWRVDKRDLRQELESGTQIQP